MTNVTYKVGRDGYFTTCRTMSSAVKQKKEDESGRAQIVTVYETVKEPYKPMSAERAEKVAKYFDERRKAKSC